MSRVIHTTVVRDYESGGQLVTIDGHDRYVKYACTHTTSVPGEAPIEGFDEIWLDVNGKVVRIHTVDGLDCEY